MHFHTPSLEIAAMTPIRFVRERAALEKVYQAHMKNIGLMNGLRFK